MNHSLLSDSVAGSGGQQLKLGTGGEAADGLNQDGELADSSVPQTQVRVGEGSGRGFWGHLMFSGVVPWLIQMGWGMCGVNYRGYVMGAQTKTQWLILSIHPYRTNRHFLLCVWGCIRKEWKPIKLFSTFWGVPKYSEGLLPVGYTLKTCKVRLLEGFLIKWPNNLNWLLVLQRSRVSILNSPQITECPYPRLTEPPNEG